MVESKRRIKAPQFKGICSTGDEREDCEKRVNDMFFVEALLDKFHEDTRQDPVTSEDSVYLGR